MHLFERSYVLLPAVGGEHLLECGNGIRERACNGIDRGSVDERAGSSFAPSRRGKCPTSTSAAPILSLLKNSFCKRLQISGRQFLKFDLGRVRASARLKNKRGQPPVALQVVGIGAAFGQLAGRSARRLNAVELLRPQRPAEGRQFLAIEIQRLVDGFGGNQHQQRLVRVELNVAGIFRKRHIVFERTALYCTLVALPCAGATVMNTPRANGPFLSERMRWFVIRAAEVCGATYFCHPSAASALSTVSAVCATGLGVVKIVLAGLAKDFLGAGDPRQPAGIERSVGLRFGFRTTGERQSADKCDQQYAVRDPVSPRVIAAN